MTAAGSARLAQAFPHVHVTNFAQLSSGAEPRPTQKTLVTRSFQPVSNAMYYAPFPENDDRNARLNFRTMFSLLVISVRKTPGSKTRSPFAGSG